MRRYRVRHTTQYRYGAPVTSSLTLAHLLPRPLAGQRVGRAEIEVAPTADYLASHEDAFGNVVTFIGVERPHGHLDITATSDVEVDEPVWPASLPAWEEAVAHVLEDRSPEGLLARACRLDSPLVRRAQALADYARPSFPAGAPLDEALRHLSARIHDEFVFDPGYTDVTTPLDQVLAARRGVCQDFAHLAIGCLRSLGLAARYVSGYLETQPPPGQAKLVGADASHAWCAVFVPDSGWLALDPTNDQVPPRHHVTLAWGRDYGDVVPVKGVVFGPATTQELAVAVDVDELVNS